ncbi:HlyC/CorC family transporter [Natronincola ferrireducens]|uniref:Putative hemolysin n=1 Tax=Natronincola ferrireducens TaxID=393762 RepID=A0A1G9ED40_9FIRM|nr:CNNM domain-containing protein [Natronincola ferrireducens]SDK74026.1 putative hemolysin [Natronincola ferrireducens]
MNTNIIIRFFVLIVLLCFSAFFSASETALMALGKIRVRHMVEEKIKGAILVEKLTQNPNKLLGSILVANNAINIGASALATSLALEFYPNNGVAVATITMTILVLIFGEITPKSLAARNSEQVSLKVGKTISFTVSLLNPIVVILIKITNNLIKMLGGKIEQQQPIITEEELMTIVNVSHEEGVLEGNEREMIHNVVAFGDLQIKDVMVPRTDMIALNIDLSYEEIMGVVKDEQYSRYPIYSQDIDNIIGILNVKDLIFLDSEIKDFDIKKYIREPYFTFEFNRITKVFQEMKKNRTHIAIVLDEYGGTVGIITIEDLIEEIVGDIQDEYDEIENEIEIITDKEYIINGSVKLYLINHTIGVKIKSDDFDSIGGFIIEQLGKIPQIGDEVKYNNMKFIVEDVYKNRVQKVKMIKND